jgi:two-component system LytT family response regulator
MTRRDAKVSVLVADDEPLARGGLADMLDTIDWVARVGEAASGPAAVEAIDRLRPEVVLLDVQMPGKLGIDVLRAVRHQPLVVFTTAYAQHAVDAFELGALDYLLKPFGRERLVAAMERVRAALGEPLPASPLDRLAEALAQRPMSRLFVRRGAAIQPVAVADVAWFEALGDYVAAHTESGRHLVHLSLLRLESRLDPARFARVHRNAIVNLDRVKAFRPVGRGRLVAELVGGGRVEVSRARSRAVRELVR